METTEQKETFWQKHPILVVFGALVANLCIAFLWALAICLIEDHIYDPNESFVNFSGWGLFAFIFIVFMWAVYLTGWGADSRFERVCVIIGTSLFLMVAWFICILIMAVIGMGFLARLYS